MCMHWNLHKTAKKNNNLTFSENNYNPYDISIDKNLAQPKIEQLMNSTTYDIYEQEKNKRNDRHEK